MASLDDTALPELVSDNIVAATMIPESPQETSRATPPTEETIDTCRICRGEASENQPLFYPCKCSGSIRYVHQECLMEWLSHSKKKYCELCKTPFRFTKMYDTSMPTNIPIHTFVRQLAVHFFHNVLRWLRYLLVAVIWLVAVPWCIRQVWRGLFWLADGNWVPEGQQQLASNSTNEAGQGIASDIDGVTSSTAHPDQSQSTFGALLRFLSGDTFAAKLLRILFSIPPIQFGASTDDRPAPSPPSRHPPRQPSLLSGFRFIGSWTGSKIANNISIDVMEGMLVCLGLVASFILVFLIREWVINQQPMLNNPDAQDADNANAVVDDLRAQRAIRRARRRRPNLRDPPAGIDAGFEGLIEAAAIPHPTETVRPRAMTDDNIVVASNPELSRPDLPARAQSLQSPSVSVGDPTARVGPVDEVAPLLVRGMVGEAVDARRALEEIAEADGLAHDTAFEQSAADFADQSRSQTAIFPGEEQNRLPTPPPWLHLSTEATSDQTSSDNLDELNERTSATSSVRTSVVQDTGAPTQASDGVAEANLAQDDQADAPTTLNGSTAATLGDVSEMAAEITDAMDNGHPETLLGKIAAWFWYVEGVPDPQLHQDLPHEQTGTANADANAEARFVAAGGPAHGQAHGAAPEAPRPPQLLPEDALGGIDLNDPNALEDAEDLEGVLELIGMEGPLLGMIQNVVFSLLLISLTLSAAVWIPYIWGKIALILLANPVAVVFKAPIYLITHFVDLVADICFFLLGLLGLIFNMLAKTVKQATKPVIPAYSNMLDTEKFEELVINVTHRSGTRLERTLADTITIFNPDLPTFSMQSHRALLSFKASIKLIFSSTRDNVVALYRLLASTDRSVTSLVANFGRGAASLPRLAAYLADCVRSMPQMLKSLLQPSLRPVALDPSSAEDVFLVQWSAQDRIIAIVLGYLFFALMGFFFLKIAHAVLGLKKSEKVEGPVADRLREAGGVMKVVVIIGIEMIVFPLYCGLLLDLALLPLFEGATVQTRLSFIAGAPFTGLFLHWFAGTCYMFHFALFVSMCRKILRKGVLYFIRDPDDPTFHPVRDVLERPVPTQLGKIAFSALVYGGLVIMCLGGVVWGLGRFTTALPIRWTGTHPRLAFPVDVVFFNFLLPFLVRRIKPSEKIAKIYEWWFRGVAHGLRLSHFLFGDEREDEKQPRIQNGILFWRKGGDNSGAAPTNEGTYVRAPASDSCRIPKHQKAFLEVNENNVRVDGQRDHLLGLHGSKNDNFAKIWLPPQFKPRIATFVVLLWLFAAGTGIACTIGPLVIGRLAIKLASGLDEGVNDLYALTVGLHLVGVMAALVAYFRPLYAWIQEQVRGALPAPGDVMVRVLRTSQYLLGLLYLAVILGIILPFTLSLLTELYIHIPVFTFLFDREKFIASAPDTSDAKILAAATALSESAPTNGTSKKIPPTIYVLQTWTLGLLYLRLIIRIATNYPCPHTRISTALRMIVRNGFWHPDVRLATRAVIVPLTLACSVLIATPVGLARLILHLGRLSNPADISRVYRFAYPGALGVVAFLYASWLLKNRLASWRIMVRDEVYLVGERLHNYASHAAEGKDKGKGKAVDSLASESVVQAVETDTVQSEADTHEGMLLQDW